MNDLKMKELEVMEGMEIMKVVESYQIAYHCPSH
jgi:hypothetical protein